MTNHALNIRVPVKKSLPRLRYLRGLVLCLPLLLVACGGGSGGSNLATAPTTPPTATPQATAPVAATSAQQNGASIVSLTTSTSSAAIYYTVDGSEPTTTSPRYEAPFLVAANVTLKAIATANGMTNSSVATKTFSPNIPANTLVWSDEFTNSGTAMAAPDPKIWGYDTGAGGYGNHELQNYCAATATNAPCDSAKPNAYVGTDSILHVVARQPTSGTYTSARLKSQGLFSFQYGRLEIRARAPEAQGLWPAIWTLGNSIATANWPASGEQDILERVNGPLTPDWNTSSVHGTGFTGVNIGTKYNFPAGQTAADWHTYGMIWKPGSVAYYIDDAAHPYATFTTSSISGFSGAVWPFDTGQSNFIIINLAVGGDWPGLPDSTTPFPSEMQVDYVRLYTN